MTKSRFGQVVLCGAPNAGKSTLLNQLLGRKQAITAHRAHTTRSRILGVRTLADAQIVFIDTPGLSRPRPRRLNRELQHTAYQCLAGSENDLVVFLIEPTGWRQAARFAFSQVKQALAEENCKVLLAINKVDKVADKSALLPLIEESGKLHDFVDIVPVSALSPRAAKHLLPVISQHLPFGEPCYRQDFVPLEDELLAELIREQLISGLGDELPYTTAVVLRNVEAEPEQHYIEADIWVERAAQKALIIGRGGKKLKQIGTRAREQMKKVLKRPVELRLQVRERRNWSDDPARLRQLGYRAG